MKKSNESIIKETEKYILKNKKNIIQDLANWIKINSVYDASTISAENPYGSNVTNSLNYIIELGQKAGFKSEKLQ